MTSGDAISFPPASDLAERRERIYDSFFGRAGELFHDAAERTPPIDVFVHPLGEPRGFYTAVTSGMRGRPITTPPRTGREFRRAELIFYAAAPRPEFVDLLRLLARQPHELKQWFHWGHLEPLALPDAPQFNAALLEQRKHPIAFDAGRKSYI